MKFLIIQGELLSNKDLRSDHKLILAYLLGLRKSGKYFYGSTDYLAAELGANIKAVEYSIRELISFGFLVRDAANSLQLVRSDEEIYNYTRNTQMENVQQEQVSAHIARVSQLLKMN